MVSSSQLNEKFNASRITFSRVRLPHMELSQVSKFLGSGMYTIQPNCSNKNFGL